MSETRTHHITIPQEYAGFRIDKALAQLFPEYSRMRIQEWIKKQKIKVNDQIIVLPAAQLQGNETIRLEAEIESKIEDQPEPIALNIIYEDDDILVINKPVGLVVHPGPGNRAGTLLNALLYHDPQLAKIPRAGIVHRLDQGTSGLLVIAKTLNAHLKLIKQLQKREIHREYEAIVYGALTGGGTIEAPLGRHPKKRTHIAIVASGKPAVTHYRILNRFQHFTHIQVNLETGRTHQIRVHMASIKHHLVGDSTYGGGLKLPKRASVELIEALKTFKHQALHARKLGLKHPTSGKWMEWAVEPPEDFKKLLTLLS
ncbi:MAG: 23S rRNA pseudouridine(1911/1915/1917) synthase RluD [Gammaproteobacteria bacterium]|nr:23S rRNA pseudouridine(1911/1915/1917) synthase RluD [Gammaproteobacteria bacterium]